jgi:hypothetical protein
MGTTNLNKFDNIPTYLYKNVCILMRHDNCCYHNDTNFT